MGEMGDTMGEVFGDSGGSGGGIINEGEMSGGDGNMDQKPPKPPNPPN